MSSRDEELLKLDDYASGELKDAEAEAFEEQLFQQALEGSSEALSFRDGLVRRMKDLRTRGSLKPWMRKHEAEAAVRRTDLRVLAVDIPERLAPEAVDTFDIAILKLPIDLRGIKQIDLEMVRPDGQVVKTCPDIDFDPDGDTLYSLCEKELLLLAAEKPCVFRVYAVEDGQRRLLREVQPTR